MSNKLLSNLIDNAFDFLEMGISQFESNPKYSVINFCAAVELLLKARLMHEHWSLLVVTTSHPNLNSFKNGDFKSINFKDLIPRIEAVTGDKISKDAFDAFNRLSNHRNKMIHFFHEAYSGETSQKLLEEIAVEQCNGWFYLRRLLEKWDNIYASYSEKVDSVNRSMKSHKIYLTTVFNRIKPELDTARKKGIIFCKCNRCSHKASQETKRTEYLYQYHCLVCLFDDSLLKIPCPVDGCKNTLNLSEVDFDEEVICSSGHSITKKELTDLLDTNPVTTDNYFEHTTKNCATCSQHDSVVEHDGFFICMDCFYVSDNIAYCEWCNEGQIGGGDLENSNYTGCEFCDGFSGWVTYE